VIYADLPAGATVFVDASVFIHHFEPNALYGPASTAFLQRIENNKTSAHRGCDVTIIDHYLLCPVTRHRPNSCQALVTRILSAGWQPLTSKSTPFSCYFGRR
jgi:hypothetical protein